MDLTALKSFPVWVCPELQFSNLPPGADSAMVAQKCLLSSSSGRWVSYEAVLLLGNITAPAITSNIGRE